MSKLYGSGSRRCANPAFVYGDAKGSRNASVRNCSVNYLVYNLSA
jgi:hypothetical protein